MTASAGRNTGIKSNKREGMAVVKERNSNLELYRIIVMFLIVMHHYVVNSDLISIISDNPTSPKSIYLFLTGMWGKTGINCFVLITGYFMCQSSITLRKFLKLLLEVELYGITLYLLLVVFGASEFSVARFAWYSLPIRYISNVSFTDAYLAFFLFIPFMNILVSNMNRKTHFGLLCLLIAIFSVFAKMPKVQVSMSYVTWFIVIYLIGAYIRMYPIRERDQRFWGRMSLMVIGLSMLSVIGTIVVMALMHRPCARSVVYYFVEDSNALLAVITSICLFMFFKSVKIKQSRLINVIGGGTFGVLLIHDNLSVRPWLWNELLDNGSQYTSNNIYLLAIIVPVAVFIVCSFIEYLRGKYIEQPILDLFYGAIRSQYPNIK